MTQHFFRKAAEARTRPRPPKQQRPDHQYKIVMIRKTSGQLFAMSSAKLAHLQGASKGGQTTAGRPNPGRFTSTSGRKAALKVWKTRWKFNRRIGTRIGRRAKPRPRIAREPLRQFYTMTTKRDIRFDAQQRLWYLAERPITERTALQRLGYLPKPGRFVPLPEDVAYEPHVRLPSLIRGAILAHTGKISLVTHDDSSQAPLS